MVEADWTYEQALEAQQAALASGAVRTIRKTPLGDWLNLRSLDALQKSFEGGNSAALMVAVERCGVHGVPLPDWVSAGFSDACERIRRFEAASWDVAFGRAHPKGTHVAQAEIRRRHRLPIYHHIKALREGVPPRKIDDALFDEVGEKFGVGRTLCKELYYEVENSMKAWSVDEAATEAAKSV